MNDQPEEYGEHEHDHGHPPHGFWPFAISREEWLEQVDQQQAQIDAAAHRGVSFFESLNEEQLLTMRGLVNAMAANPEMTLPYYMGVISTHLQHRFGVCPACSKKHDDELIKLVQTGKDEMSHGQADTDDEEMLQQAKAWGVEFIGMADGRPLSVTPVKCVKNCGATNPTLADRMLKPAGPSGCPGCIHISKNG